MSLNLSNNFISNNFFDLCSGIDILLANELLEKRAETHKFWHPAAEMICGNITDKKIKDEIALKSYLSNHCQNLEEKIYNIMEKKEKIYGKNI